MNILSINTWPVVIDGPGIYLCRNGTRACIHEIKPFLDPAGKVDRREVTAFEAKGAFERMYRGKMRFRGLEGWHVSGRYRGAKESQWDIVSKELTMRYICIQCGAGGASAFSEKNPPPSYNCHVCPPPVQPGTMWPAEHAELLRSALAAYDRANSLAHSRPLTLYLADCEVKVQYRDDLMSFTHGEMQIRNPMLSACGRFAADPKDYGFEGWASGGGCVALRKELDNGRYLLLTHSDGIDLPDATSDDLLGLYTQDGDPLALIRVGDIPFSE